MKLNDNRSFSSLLFEEHDSCGIVTVIEKSGIATHENLKKSIDALVKMDHRSGFINGEGDGSGLLTDIPRKLWADRLSKNNIPSSHAYSPNFVVGHIFIDPNVHSISYTKDQIKLYLQNHHFEIIYDKESLVESKQLGPNGRENEPYFWQMALLFHGPLPSLRKKLFSLTLEIEQNNYVHVASLSNYSVIYKVMGGANVLEKYYLDLSNPLFQSAITLGHNRYSTNTLSHFFRVQPFSLLGHNGEINTIQKLREEAKMINIPLVKNGSDSQDLNRIIEGLITKYDLSLFSVLELIFPPIYNEILKYNSKLQDLYTFLRHLWGPFSQGPAGIVSRFEDYAIFSVDGLGLRPLWKIETEDTLFFSSEQGIVNSIDMINEPKPLAPGEKIGVVLSNETSVTVLNYHEIQQLIYEEISGLFPLNNYYKKLEPPHFKKTSSFYSSLNNYSNHIYKAFGWEKEHIDLAEQMATTGKEPIRSLGYDGPLAILSKNRVNVSDFLKETVAVVTNPAIDREREIEHFSTRMILGGRETFSPHEVGDVSFEIRSPILLEGEVAQSIVEDLGTTSLEQTIAFFSSLNENYVSTLSLSFEKNQSIENRLEELNLKALKAIKQGAKILVLDDKELYTDNQRYWLDPHIAISSIDRTLKKHAYNGVSLRRNTSIIIRSAAIRHLHDIVTILGLGADAISPYLLFNTVYEVENKKSIRNLFDALNKGIEKVISTLGIHELRGYERLYSSIGLHQSIANVLEIKNFYGSNIAGYSFSEMEEDAKKRFMDLHNEKVTFEKNFRLTTRIWKALSEAASGKADYNRYIDKLQELEKENPIAIRHLLDFKYPNQNQGKEVSIRIGEHDLPFVISSMSFGSQNEIAFRAYAEAAYQLNMISLSGEGGEIKDMIGKYPKNRGVQIASGRFGVNVEFINSSQWIEIKVGQGAKPGEGGHLPGTKVSEKVAAARNSTPGVDLISPSNNHDVYSIEDLAQIIAELKSVNNLAKVIVKVPVVPNIGTIAVGIAKAGADVISLSGYDGGTGAARVHAIQHVGLPVEIGIKLSHSALVESGLRPDVEIWADGGVRSGRDVVKLVLLGANRVGFGTLSMIAIGCTTCRGCHLDTCHVGISTQIDSVEQANERGLRRFVPRNYDLAVNQLKRLFLAIAEETKTITQLLGASSLQDLVGKSELLKQMNLHDFLDLTDLLKPMVSKTAIITLNNKQESHLAVGAEEATVQYNEFYNFNYDAVNCTHRMIGTYESGARTRPIISSNIYNNNYKNHPLFISLKKGSVAGNGLASYLAAGIDIEVHGGGQDGIGKTAYGGRVSLIKTKNNHGVFVNGSAGKSCCYGAQSGLFIIQGNADSRAGIRLSGADIIIGGEIKAPIQDQLGGIGARANIKGFAFEYMTNGRAVVLGDPGPWICSGMTGGVIYQRLVPEFGLDQSAIKRRIAKGAKVSLLPIDEKGKTDLIELLNIYLHELTKTNQTESAVSITRLLNNLDEHFIKIVPESAVIESILQTE